MPDSEPPLDRRDLSDEKERLRAIEDVLRDQGRREVLRDIVYRYPRTRVRARVTAGMLAVTALAAWFIPVPGLRPEIPFPIPPAEEEAGLRLATWIQVQEVEAFRRRRGRLPDVLREAGEPLPGMSYERIDARAYRLTGATERVAITWTSTDSTDTRLRDSAERLRGLRP